MSEEVTIEEGVCLAERVERRYMLDVVNLSFGKLIKAMDDFHDTSKTQSKQEIQKLITENQSIIDERNNS